MKSYLLHTNSIVCDGQRFLLRLNFKGKEYAARFNNEDVSFRVGSTVILDYDEGKTKLKHIIEVRVSDDQGALKEFESIYNQFDKQGRAVRFLLSLDMISDSTVIKIVESDQTFVCIHKEGSDEYVFEITEYEGWL